MKSDLSWAIVGQTLAELLDFPPLAAVEAPFDVGGGYRWELLRFEQQAEGAIYLQAGSENGLLVEWHLRFFGSTRAIEVRGRVQNQGTETARVCNPSSWSVKLEFAKGEPPPWSRTFAGASCISVVYPPPDFAPRDVQFVEAIQAWSGIFLDSGRDGRSSFDFLPMQVVTNGRQTRGLACALEWSGHWHLACAPLRAYSPRQPEGFGLRWGIGMNRVDLDLSPGASLELPTTLVTSFRGGLDAGTASIRNHIRREVMPDLNGELFLPPTSFNHWFGFENRFTAALLTPSVSLAAELGIETFCVDGGWFKGGFRKGIGNWEEGDPEKFPEGIAAFSRFVRSQGLRYGTWFEPEFAHRKSTFYRAHPDWFWETPTAPERLPDHGPYLSADDREVHLVNFGLPEVQNWWVERIKRAYDEWGVRWIRWDCNQALGPNWESGVRPGEYGRRQIDHIQGLYRTWDHLREQCPDLILEQCASGGRRIDLGTIRRGHTFWMNDFTSHSDMVRAFQANLNRLLPGNYANTNLCQQREDYTPYDLLSHGMGGFGFSGRLEDLSRETQRRLREFIVHYKAYRPLLLGDYEFLEDSGPKNGCASTARFSDGARSLTFEFNCQEGCAALTLDNQEGCGVLISQ